MTLRKRTGRARRETFWTQASRRRLADVIRRAPRIESLKDRRLLAVFSNPDVITINDLSAASPYPSVISVSGLAGNIIDVNVRLHGITHTFPITLTFCWKVRRAKR